MTDFKEIITNWLEKGATKAEILEIAIIAERALKISDKNLQVKALEIANNEGPLQSVKFIKDQTGLGLKEAKQYFDINILPFKKK